MSKRKIIITESQLSMIKNRLTESVHYSNMVKMMKDELDNNYQPTNKFFKEGGEYKNKAMFIIKVDGEVISADKLFEYIHKKYGISNPEFTKQVIRDWVDGKISKTYQLSKNIPMN